MLTRCRSTPRSAHSTSSDRTTTTKVIELCLSVKQTSRLLAVLLWCVVKSQHGGTAACDFTPCSQRRNGHEQLQYESGHSQRRRCSSPTHTSLSTLHASDRPHLSVKPITHVRETRTRNSCELTRARNLYVCYTDLQRYICLLYTSPSPRD